jgi:hypothetical protein
MAEIAAAFAGFAGVVAAFGKTNLEPEVRLWRVQTLIVTSVAALFGCLVPSLVALLDVSEEGIWRISSACMFAIVFSQLMNVYRNTPAQIGTGYFRLARTPIGALLTTGSLTVQGLLLSVSFGAFYGAQEFIYAVSAVFLLLAASYHFLVLVRSVQARL